MADQRPRHADWDGLVFFLTSKLSQEEKQDVVGLIEREEFKDRVVALD